jgi:transposase
VQLRWRSRRFFCDADDCPQRIFTERLAQVADAHGRATTRMVTALQCVAFACGGQGGARLADRLGMPTSPDRLLRLIRRAATTPSSTPRVLGVDDWALRRDHRYGTILCDLEQHRPIDLLPERSSEGFAAWLTSHPGVQVISRDRGEDYTKGATTGAPQAIQVADRWHLVHNLHEAMVRVVDRHRAAITDAVKAAAPSASVEASESSPATSTNDSHPPIKLTQTEQCKQRRRTRRLERYNRLVALRHQGMSLRAIARQEGMHRGTVRRYLNADGFPERATRTYVRRTDSVVEYLRERWQQGCRNAVLLTAELQNINPGVSYTMVRRRVAAWREAKDAGATPGPKPATSPVIQRPSPTRVAWLLVKKDDELEPEQQAFRDHLLANCPELEIAATLCDDFRRLVRDRQAGDLDTWIELATSKLAPSDLCRFARGLTTDLAAIKAALTLPWSNGQVEGQVNRLKLIKRQMYGRAKFDLLKSRVLHAG